MKELIRYFNSLGVSPDVSVPIVLFFAGIIASILGYEAKRILEKRAYKISLLQLLKDLKEACVKQHSIISDSLKKTGLKHGNNFIVNYIPIGTIEFLSSIDYNVLIQNTKPLLPIKKKKIVKKALSKLISCIALLKQDQKENKELLTDVMQVFRNNESLFYSSIDALRKLNDKYLNQLFKNIIPNARENFLFLRFTKIFKDWIDDGAIVSIQNEYLFIVGRIFELKSECFDIDGFQSILDICLEAKLAYKNIENVDNMLHEKFKLSAHFYRRTAKLLNVIIEVL